MCGVLSKFKTAYRIIIITIITNFFLIAIKIYLFVLTLSLAVLAYLMDSLMDLMNDVIAIYGAKIASKPADRDHPYGHTKYDAFYSLIISSLIIGGAIEIFRDTAISIIYGRHVVFFSINVLYIFILLACIYSAIALVEFIYAKKLGIAIMAASALHYITDPVFTFIVFLGVYLSHIGYVFVDYILSIVIGIILISSAIRQIRKQSVVLLDVVVLDPEKLRRVIMEKFPEVKDVHEITSRTDGVKIFLEFHIWLDPHLTLREAHDKAHQIQEYVESYIGKDKKTRILIHIEPEQ